MSDRQPESVAEALSAAGIDNYAVSFDIIRVGTRYWREVRCSCDRADCKGWALEPVPAPPLLA